MRAPPGTFSDLARATAPKVDDGAGTPLSEQIDELRQLHGAEVHHLESELEAARRVAEEAAALAAGLLRSSSWSITRPLRVVSERLRGRRWSEPTSPEIAWSGAASAAALIAAESLAATPEFVAQLAFKASASPVVSIIVPTYGKLGMTARCLRSIQRHSADVEFEVIVVEDRSGDPLIGMLANVPGLVYHENETNLGFLRSCNAASSMARGEFICLLNNDTEVRPGWLDALLDIHSRFPDCGVVGSKLLFPDGSLQEAGGIIWADGSGWNVGRNGDPRAPEFNYAREVDYCSGAAVLMRTELFRSLGGFDERFAPAYYEDADLAFRVRERGLKVYYCPRSEVVHVEGVSHGTRIDAGIKAYQARNRKIFRARWRHELDRGHYRDGECEFRARDHARRRPVVLVTDHMVPRPDRDAGSRAMLQTMVRLAHMGMVVKFWPDDHQYDRERAAPLEDAGVEIVTGERWGGSFEKYVRRVGQELDYAVLSRPNFALPYLTALREYSRARVALYGHDIHYRRMLAQAEVTADANVRKAAADMQELEQSLWLEVDRIIYPSREEADFVAAFAGAEKVHSVPLYCFGESDMKHSEATAGTARLLFVAGFGHPPNEDAAEWLVGEILPRIRAELPDAVLHLVGSHPTVRVRRLAGPGVILAADVSAGELARQYAVSHVAIAPLRFGGGVKLKVVEAMAQGVPMVTTSVGAQGLPDIDTCIGVADDAQGLADMVVRLVRDRDWAIKRASAGHDYLRQHYSETNMEHALWRAVCGSPESLLAYS